MRSGAQTFKISGCRFSRRVWNEKPFQRPGTKNRSSLEWFLKSRLQSANETFRQPADDHGVNSIHPESLNTIESSIADSDHSEFNRGRFRNPTWNEKPFQLERFIVPGAWNDFSFQLERFSFFRSGNFSGRSASEPTIKGRQGMHGRHRCRIWSRSLTGHFFSPIFDDSIRFQPLTVSLTAGRI